MENNSEIDVSRWVGERLAALHAPAHWEADTATGLGRLRAAHKASLRRRRNWAWTAAAGLVLAAGVVAFPATRVFAGRCLNACLAETPLAGTFVRGQTKGMARKAAPDFALHDAFGNPLTVSGLRGRVVLLNFWATWCVPCNVEIPWFVELQRKYQDAGLVVVGISMDDDGWKAVRPVLDSKGINYPVAIGNAEVAQSYGGVESLPTTFAIDREGRIAGVHEGLQAKAAYEAELKSLLAGK